MADNWDDDGSGLWSVQMVSPNDGEYIMDGTGGQSWPGPYSAYNVVYTNFTYEADVTRVVGYDNANNGIIFRSDGTGNNCYEFGFDLDFGWFAFAKFVGGIASWISPGWVDPSCINTGLGAWNRLKVVCSGSNITLYINDVLVGAYADTEFSEGKVGAMPFDSWSDDEVHYDNICLTLDTTGSVPSSTTAPVPSQDYGDPAVAPESVETQESVPFRKEPLEPRPISPLPPATLAH